MMNNFTFSIGIYGLLFSLALRVIAAVFYAMVVKKAYDELKDASGVKNGLAKLRKQLIVTASVLFFINSAGMVLLLIRPTVTPEVFRMLTDTLSVLNSIGFLCVAWFLWQIYTQQYTPEQKELHRQIDAIERGEAVIRNISPKQQGINKTAKDKKEKGGAK